MQYCYLYLGYQKEKCFNCRSRWNRLCRCWNAHKMWSRKTNCLWLW